jgi:hypothetical protein
MGVSSLKLIHCNVEDECCTNPFLPGKRVCHGIDIDPADGRGVMRPSTQLAVIEAVLQDMEPEDEFVLNENEEGYDPFYSVALQCWKLADRLVENGNERRDVYVPDWWRYRRATDFFFSTKTGMGGAP